MNKRYEVAVYDDEAISGYCVLDKYQSCPTCRLKYHNVFISTKDGCEIVTSLLNELNDENNELKRNLTSYQNMVEQYINLHIDKIRRRYVNPTREEVAERTRIIRDLEQLKKELI